MASGERDRRRDLSFLLSFFFFTAGEDELESELEPSSEEDDEEKWAEVGGYAEADAGRMSDDEDEDEQIVESEPL